MLIAIYQWPIVLVTSEDFFNTNFDIRGWISALGLSDIRHTVFEKSIMNRRNAIDLFQCSFKMLKLTYRKCIGYLCHPI